MFSWSNYLYACGPCNGPKNNGFAIVEDVGGRAIATSVARKRTDPIAPPRAGPAALIDPRREDPLAHLMLDLQTTLLFRPVGADGSESRARAEYTIELLHLNTRANLPKARWAHYRAYRALLREYVEEKQDGAEAARLREAQACDPCPAAPNRMGRNEAPGGRHSGAPRVVPSSARGARLVGGAVVP